MTDAEHTQALYRNMRGLNDEIGRLRTELKRTYEERNEYYADRERLRAERDEARDLWAAVSKECERLGNEVAAANENYGAVIASLPAPETDNGK